MVRCFGLMLQLWGLSVWPLFHVLCLPPCWFVLENLNQRCFLDGVIGRCCLCSDHLGGLSELLLEVGGTMELTLIQELWHIRKHLWYPTDHFQTSPAHVHQCLFCLHLHTLCFFCYFPISVNMNFPSGTPFAFSSISIHMIGNPSPSPPTFALILHLPEASWWMRLLPEDG